MGKPEMLELADLLWQMAALKCSGPSCDAIQWNCLYNRAVEISESMGMTRGEFWVEYHQTELDYKSTHAPRRR